MTGQRSPGHNGVQPSGGSSSRVAEIRNILEEIIGIAGEAEKKQKSGRPGKSWPAAIRERAEKALSVLAFLSIPPSRVFPPENGTAFSISRICSDTADIIGKKQGTSPWQVSLAIDSSVPPLVGGDRFRLEAKLGKILEEAAASAPGEKITLSAVVRRHCPDGADILFSAEGAEKSFSFAMAFSEEPGDETPETPPEQPLALLAEDNPLSSRILASSLGNLGLRVMTASTGREALSLAGEHRFDIILMDVQMPELDGIEAVKAIRKKEKGTGRHVPVLAISAAEEEEEKIKCLGAGMDGFLPKASSPGVLAQAVSRFLPGRVHPGQPDTPGMPALLSATGGNREAAADAAEFFLQSAPPLIAGMKRAVARGDRLLLASHAHRIKGSLAFFGAAKAAGLAGTMEEAAKNSSLEELPSLLYSLISEINLLLAEIRKERRSG